MIRLTSTLLISCALAACGGGGGNAGTGSPASISPASPSPGIQVDKTGPSVGDFHTYKLTGYSDSLRYSREDYASVYETELTTAVTGATATITTLYGDQYTGWYGGSATLTGIYSAGRQLSCTTTYAAQSYGPPAILALDANWDNGTTLTKACKYGENDREIKLASKGSVVAVEDITVAGGTFRAYKLVATVNELNVRISMDGHRDPATTTISKLTSWIDVATGVELKRTVDATSGIPATKDYRHAETTRELIGLSHAKSGRHVLVVERFAGPGWNGTYSGARGGTSQAQIFEGGSTDVRFAVGDAANYTIFPPGKIDNNGEIRLAQPGGDATALTFTGKAESLTKISGTWRDNSGATGTWSMTRDD